VNPNKFKQRRTVPRLFTTLFITSMAGAFVPLAHAVDWQGSVSADWGNAGNWSSASVPSTDDAGVTVDGATVQPVLSGPVAASVGQVDVKSGALTVSAGDLTTPYLAVGFKQGEVGELKIVDGGKVRATNPRLSAAVGGRDEYRTGTGAVLVDGVGSTWTNDGAIAVGFHSDGTLTVKNGGSVTTKGNAASADVSGSIGVDEGSPGTVVIDGSGSTWANTGVLHVGDKGVGALTIGNGGQVSNTVAVIGTYAGSTGSASVDGKDSGWTSNGTLYVGARGAGELMITSGGRVTQAFEGLVGFDSGSTGEVVVDGVGSTWDSGGGIAIGRKGAGSLTISNGGLVKSAVGIDGSLSVAIGSFEGGLGSVLVTGPGSSWEGKGELRVGGEGQGTLIIRDGGRVFNDVGGIAVDAAQSKGTVDVDGEGSSWTNSSFLLVGREGSGSLKIRNGGVVTSVGSDTTLAGGIGEEAGATGTVQVDGPGSAWEAKGQFVVGAAGKGTLTIQDGGRVSSTDGVIGATDSGQGTVTVDGKDSKLVSSGSMRVGRQGTGSLTISNDGAAKALKVVIANEAKSTGTLNIGAAAGDAAAGAGTLDTPTVEFGKGTGKLVFNHTNTDYRFSPVVSGAGRVEVHAGTTQFGDANSYSGGTAIHGGTLVGTATSFGSGAIANDGELVVDQAVKAAFNNALSGKGNFIKRGAGQLDFASDGSGFTGATQVAAGALSVNGSLANSRVTVASGATLKGNGTVGATSILAGGTIAPGNSIGTLTVKGNYTQAAGSTYQAEVDPATLSSSDHILVGGTATLEEGAILNVVKTAPRDYQPGARYDVLKAQGGVKGAYKLTGDTDLSAFIGLRQATTDDGVYLLTVQTKPLAAAAATPNQAAVANAILPAAPIVAPPTAPAVVQPTAPAVVQPAAPAVVQPTAPAAAQPTAPAAAQPAAPAAAQPAAPTAAQPAAPTAAQPAAPVATRPTATAAAQPATPSAAQVQPARSVLTTALLNQQTDAAARAAFDQLSGDVHASVKGALLDDSRFVRGAALERLRDASSCVSTDNTATTCSASRSTPTVWASTFGSWGHAAQLDRTIGGFAAGADVAVGDTWRLGVMTGYSHSSFQADARHASAKSDDYHLGVYGGSRWGDLSLRLGTAYTRHEIDTTRNVRFSGFSGKPEAQYRASTTQAFGELGYQVQAGAVALEPFANLAYVNLHTNRFNERGGEAALRSSGTDNDATFTTLGLHAQTEWALGGVPVTAKGTLGWQHAFGGTVPNARFSLAGGRSFDIEGTPIARDAALVEAGLNFKVAPQANLSITYAGKFGGHANDQSVRANFAMKF
jgi:fibronectin-binding autotransporter adhesin